MELRQLRYFVAVVETGSFTKAAARCFVSQPSLSQQIAKLEEYLGQRLFERLGRTVRLTPAGRRLYAEAAPLLAGLADVEERVRAHGKESAGRLTLGVVPTLAPYLLSRLLVECEKRWPSAEIEVREDHTDRLVECCLAGTLEMLVLAFPAESAADSLQAEIVAREELMLAMAPTHPLAGKGPVALDAVEREPFVALTAGNCLSSHASLYCDAIGFEPRIQWTAAQLVTVQQLVAAGNGLALVPAMAAAADTSGTVAYSRVESVAGESPARELGLARLPGRQPSVLHRNVASLLREMLVERVGASRAGSAAGRTA